MTSRFSRIASAFTLLMAAPAALAPAARAQTPPDTHDAGATELSLDAEGRASASPDLLTATLFAQASSGNLASAQTTLNAMVAHATQSAATHQGVEVTRADYSASQSSEKPVRWTAQQTIILKAEGASDGGKAVLDTVAQLQAQNLGVSGLEWSVSPDKHDALLQTARARALKALQSQASAAAQTLGMHVVRFRVVRLVTNGGMRPPMMLMSARMASAPTPPESTPQAQDISVEASGTVILAP